MPGEIIFQNPYSSNNQQNVPTIAMGENSGTIASVSTNQQIPENQQSSRMELGTNNVNHYQNGEIPIYLNQQQNISEPNPVGTTNPEFNQPAQNYVNPNQNIGINVPTVTKKNTSSSVISVLFFVWISVGVYYFLGGSLNFDFLKGQFGLNSDQIDLNSNLENIPNVNPDGNTEKIVITDTNSSEKPTLDDIDKLFLTDKEGSATANKFRTTNASYNHNDVDTDFDSISDQAEKVLGTDPYKSDTDSDNLSDYQEISIYKTNPLKSDTDGDGSNDSAEILSGKDPKRKGF